MGIGIELGELGIGSSQVDNDQTDLLLKILAQNVIGQKGLSFPRRGKNGKVPCLDAFLLRVPDIFNDRDIVLPIIKDNALGIRFVVGVVDIQT